MSAFNTIAFVVYPYIMLTLFVVGHPYRYKADLYGWNSRSSELLDKHSLLWGITIFHWGILGTLFGHLGGLLIPQWFLDLFGFTADRHAFVAFGVGLLVGIMAFVGILMLVIRRFSRPRIRVSSRTNDLVVGVFLLIVITAGLYNVIFAHSDEAVLFGVAPWIRSILTLTPDPTLMTDVPPSYKIHILAALGLLGYSPFTRLVHIWSVPLTYVLRRFVIFRKRAAGVS